MSSSSRAENTVMGYALTRSLRKTLAIHVKPDGAVEVRAPLRLAKSEIERFVAAKLAWIEKKQAQIATRQPAAPHELPPSEYASGEFERTVRELVPSRVRKRRV